MKPNFLTSLFMSLLCVILASCDSKDEPENPVIDYTPVGFVLDIVDNNGNSLLDKTRADNILSDGLYMEMDGKRFNLSDSLYQSMRAGRSAEPAARANSSEFHGLQLILNTDKDNFYSPKGRFLLLFGYFNGGESFDHEMTLVWPERGSKYLLQIINSVTFDSEKNASISRSFFLNGKKVDGGSIIKPLTLWE
ncbi:MAG: hypothetical protein NC342_04630 [Pseudoflavonifractor sp.]|nr:hypothetical protein [Alloprevotella sp.]MCM1116803.1 hypothetical protein [Pseudoflavonifractor sp.]